MSKESVQGPLSALRNAGTVSGLCLTRGIEVLINMLPYSDGRVEELAGVIDDVFYYFGNSSRDVDQVAFGYDGASLVVVTEGDFRLLVVHMRADEVDFIAKAARAFLIDFRLGLFAEEINARSALGVQAPVESTSGAVEQPVSEPVKTTPEQGAKWRQKPDETPTQAPKKPTIKPLAPLSKEAKEPLETVSAAKPNTDPSTETAKVAKMDPARPAPAASVEQAPEKEEEAISAASDAESAPTEVPTPTAVAWSAKQSPSPSAAESEPAPAPSPPSAPATVSDQPEQPKPSSIRTHRAQAAEEPDLNAPAAKHRAHLAQRQPESTLPPRRMPRR